MRKRKQRIKAKVVRKVEAEARIILRAESDGQSMSARLIAASELSARSTEEQEREELALFREEQASKPPEERQPEPPKSSRVLERRHLMAWLHQATDKVLKELYSTLSDRHGYAELGCLLRTYLKMRQYFPEDPLSARRCPFCKALEAEKGGSG